jgi:DNA repair exonuclease SbcCD ATPase subunit
MTEEIRLSWFGKIGFTSLIILLILLLGATMGIIIGSKTRMKQLEDRIVKLEKIEYRLTQIWEQAEFFDQFKDRLDTLEVSLSKTEYLVKNLDRLPKKLAEKPPQKIEKSLHSKILSKIEQKRYQTVTSGETLFSISHQYGLPVEKIRLLNKLTDASVIHPGQRLLLSL